MKYMTEYEALTTLRDQGFTIVFPYGKPTQWQHINAALCLVVNEQDGPCPDDYCLDYNSTTPPTRCIVVKGGRWDNRIWEAQPAEHFSDDLYDEERLCEKDEVQEYRGGSKVCPYFSRKS